MKKVKVSSIKKLRLKTHEKLNAKTLLLVQVLVYNTINVFEYKTNFFCCIFVLKTLQKLNDGTKRKSTRKLNTHKVTVKYWTTVTSIIRVIYFYIVKSKNRNYKII